VGDHATPVRFDNDLGAAKVRFTLRVPFTWTDGTFDKFDLPR
jgi:hypothetical protein